jgi:hypothetical protein
VKILLVLVNIYDIKYIETTLNNKFDGINLKYFACCTYFIILIKLFLAYFFKTDDVVLARESTLLASTRAQWPPATSRDDEET